MKYAISFAVLAVLLIAASVAALILTSYDARCMDQQGRAVFTARGVYCMADAGTRGKIFMPLQILEQKDLDGEQNSG